MIHRSGIKTVYGCSVIVNVSFLYKMYFYSPGLCFFIVLPRFFQIFSIFLFIFISKRHNPWDILFFIFSPVFLFSGGFSLIFLFYRPGCTFSVFYRFIWFHYNFFCFYGFNIFLSLPRLLSSFPSFWLTFLFFCKQSHFFSFINIFYSFSPFFIPHRHFTPFSCLSLPLPPVFILFAHVYTTFSPFQSFFAFSQLIFIFFAFSASFIFLHPLFAIFLDRPSFFRFYLCHFLRLIFHVSRLSKCFTWNIVFYDFRSSAISEKRFAFRLSENHSHFSPLLFLKQSYFLFYFWFSRLFYIFPVFLRVSRSFSSLLSLFY